MDLEFNPKNMTELGKARVLVFLAALVFLGCAIKETYLIPPCKEYTITYFQDGENITVTSGNITYINELVNMWEQGLVLKPQDFEAALQQITTTTTTSTITSTSSTIDTTTTTTTTESTTTTTCLLYNPVVIDEALNYHASTGTAAYQSGIADAKDYYLNLFKIPGRPKFRSRPMNLADLPKPDRYYGGLVEDGLQDENFTYDFFNFTQHKED